jgi:hypothetical protein
MGRRFDYDIDRLAQSSKSEFMRLVTDLIAMEQEEQRNTEDSEDRLDLLLAELEADLEEKMSAMTAFQEEMNEYATERDFYLSKLLKIEKLCKRFSPEDVEAVVSILKASSAEFLPPAQND